MLSKFVFPSRYSRLVVVALCLVSACFQQIMSLEHGHKSHSSSKEKSHISSIGDVQQQSKSLPTSRITVDEMKLLPAVLKHISIPNSNVPADISSKKKLAAIAPVPVQQVPSAD